MKEKWPALVLVHHWGWTGRARPQFKIATVLQLAAVSQLPPCTNSRYLSAWLCHLFLSIPSWVHMLFSHFFLVLTGNTAMNNLIRVSLHSVGKTLEVEWLKRVVTSLQFLQILPIAFQKICQLYTPTNSIGERLFPQDLPTRGDVISFFHYLPSDRTMV